MKPELHSQAPPSLWENPALFIVQAWGGSLLAFGTNHVLLAMEGLTLQ
jgi:hypothetical protein